jgi:hypothetical protein
MRTFTIIHFILLLVLLLAYQCAGAQDRVITMKGDTIQGKIKLLNFGDVPKVQIQKEGEKKTVLTMFETKEVLFDGEVYHPQKAPYGYTYMKLLKSGYLSLYGFRYENQNPYDGRLLVKKDGSSIEVPNLTFKKALKNFLQDCEEVADKLEAGDYNKKDLDMIISDYNTCIEGKSMNYAAVQTTAPLKVEPPTTGIQAQWIQFKEKVASHSEFSGKADALDIMEDISKKLSRNEKVPNFLTQSLRSALKETDLNGELETLLAEIQKL